MNKIASSPEANKVGISFRAQILPSHHQREALPQSGTRRNIDGRGNGGVSVQRPVLLETMRGKDNLCSGIFLF